jgi:hypothetical protein
MLKNITLSAEGDLIQKARQKAVKEKSTLNALFRHWLNQYVEKDKHKLDFDALMGRLKHVRAGRKFTREQMNER